MNKKVMRNIFVGLSFAGLYISSYRMFHNYISGVYESDFLAHINTAVSDNPGYSLMHILIEICYKFPKSELILSLVMNSIIFGTYWGMYRYLSGRNEGVNSKEMIAIIATSLLFTSNIYLPVVFEHFYNHYTTVSQPWHNSTYILMRLFSVWVIFLFFIIYEELTEENKISKKNAILFWLVLSLCNFAKPNFFLAFAPASLCVFLILLVKNRNYIFNLLKWGCCYLLSMPILYYMVRVVYEKSENSQIAFCSQNFLDYLFGHAGVGVYHGQFIILEISNLLFPFFVIATLVFLKIKGKKIYLYRVMFGMLLFCVAHLEQLLMIETGPRAQHGNYAWGVYCAGMILYMICIEEWIKTYHIGEIQKKYYLIGFGLFAMHIFCGIVYYIELCMGMGYVI